MTNDCLIMIVICNDRQSNPFQSPPPLKTQLLLTRRRRVLFSSKVSSIKITTLQKLHPPGPIRLLGPEHPLSIVHLS